ncbi:hypothetical protein BDZ89DRAFT_1027721 [Hymenopellis radicata]|nr:hypothetical protein BDZ89DRAFT_1027721 [Hymenopellis radicata]
MPRLGSKAEAHDVEVTERSEALDSEVGNSTKSTGSSIEFTGEGAILRDVYAVFKQFKRQPPKGGYPFPKRDDVKTKLGRAPPSPCKCCGSQYHWDPECPEYDTYQERRRQKAQERSAHSVALETFDSQDPERAYDAGYQVLIAQRAAEYATQDFERASSGLGLVGKEKNTPLMTAPAKSKSPRVTIEEVLDDDLLEDSLPPCLPRDDVHVMEELGVEDDFEAFGVEKSGKDPPREENRGTEPGIPSELPYSSEKPQRLRKRRRSPQGESAKDVSVLSIRGRLGHLKNKEIDLRHDSCANISLISTECYASLSHPPPIRKGERWRVRQLQKGSSEIQGYVTLPVLFEADDGETIETEVEAYLVPNMTVPILLGEDYHLNYEVITERNIEEGTKIRFKEGMPGYVKAKNHRQSKNANRRKRLQADYQGTVVRSKADYVIKPYTCKTVDVYGNLQKEATYYVQRGLLATADDSYFAVPNVLLDPHNPRIPISNPTAFPRRVKKDEILAEVSLASDHFDVPKDAESFAMLSERSQAVKKTRRRDAGQKRMM